MCMWGVGVGLVYKGNLGVCWGVCWGGLGGALAQKSRSALPLAQAADAKQWRVWWLI